MRRHHLPDPTKGYASFTVAHYDAKGKFCRQTFATYAQARGAAEDAAESLAGGESDARVLTGEELLIYRRAKDALKNSAVPLDVAAIHFAQSLANAGRSYGNGAAPSSESPALPPAVQAVAVAQVVDELLASKKAKGRSHLYLTDLRVRLARFGEAFDRPLCEITSGDIDKFLGSLGISAWSQTTSEG